MVHLLRRAALVLVLLASTSACSHRGAAAVAAQSEKAAAEATFPCAAETTPSGERAAGVKGALAALNETFLQTHAEARAARCAWLAHEGLVMRVSSGLLEARFRGEQVQPPTSTLPAMFHPLKDVSHALLLAALVALDEAPLHKQASLPRALSAIDAVREELAQPDSPARALIAPEHRARQARLLERARSALLAPSAEETRRELAAARPDLDENVRIVASATLRGLHEAVQAVRTRVERIDPSAWSKLLVVVGVVHQARAEALEVRYFERLLGEPMQEGALGERRLVVVEDPGSAAAQHGMLAVHLVDRLGASAVFGDARRLQRDLFSDYLEELDRLLPR